MARHNDAMSSFFKPSQRSKEARQPHVSLLLLRSSEARRSTSIETHQQQQLTPEQYDFVLGYLNQHHSDFLLRLAEVCSPLGAEMAKANVWSGGSFALDQARIVDINRQELQLQVVVMRRNQPDRTETVTISLNANPIPEKQRAFPSRPMIPDNPNRCAIDDIVRRLCRLCWIAGQPQVSGKLIQLAIQLGGAQVGKLPENLYLNQVPHNRYVRQYFYDKAAQAVHDAVVLCSQRQISNRMKIISQFPEMNPTMDSYRIGTILEMTRAIVIRLAEENLRVRVCVQGSMGVGIFTVRVRACARKDFFVGIFSV